MEESKHLTPVLTYMQPDRETERNWRLLCVAVLLLVGGIISQIWFWAGLRGNYRDAHVVGLAALAFDCEAAGIAMAVCMSPCRGRTAVIVVLIVEAIGLLAVGWLAMSVIMLSDMTGGLSNLW